MKNPLLLAAAVLVVGGLIPAILLSASRPLEILGWILFFGAPVLGLAPALRRGRRLRCAVVPRRRG